MTDKHLIGKVIFKGTLSLESGLLIGSSDDNLDIGGLDKFVVRDPLTRYPYIPGSSVKGKLRSILELLEKKPMNRHGGSKIYRYESDDFEDGYTEISPSQDIFFNGAKNCSVCRIFGSTGATCWIKESVAADLDRIPNILPRAIPEGSDNIYVKVKGRNSPARLIVRDMHLTENSAKRLKEIDTGLFMTERKSENGIDRITSAASPRQFERVPKGSEFKFEMIYTVDDEDRSKAVRDFKNILRAIFVLEDDALGGAGSRGYGKVRFLNLNFSYKDYQQVTANSSALTLPSLVSLPGIIGTTAELPQKFPDIEKLLLGTTNP